MSRSSLYFLISVLGLAGLTVMLYLGKPAGVWAFAGVALGALLLYRRSTAGTLRAIRNGMDLLRSQDFASRL